MKADTPSTQPALSDTDFVSVETSLKSMENRVAAYKSRFDEINVICVLGGPGSGKSTQSAFMAERLTAKHISIGAMMRQEIQRPDNPIADYIRMAQSQGQLGDMNLTLSVLARHIADGIDAGHETFVLDGFPRNLPRLHYFEKNIARIGLVIHLECSDDILIQRLRDRRREDDTVEGIKKRLATFREETGPVLAELRKRSERGSFCFYEMDASRHLEAVKQAIEEISF